MFKQLKNHMLIQKIKKGDSVEKLKQTGGKKKH